MKKVVSLLVSLAVLLSLCACGGSSAPETSEPLATLPAESTDLSGGVVPEYWLIDSSKYARDGKDCVGYRVEIAEDATEEGMRAVFDELSAADSYYLHTVWFYGLASDVEAVGTYTIGMLEEESEGAAAVFTAPTLSAADIETMRAHSATERSIPSPSFKQEALVPDNAFSPVPVEIFSTPANENGLGGRAYYVEGTVEERSEVGGYDSLRVSTDAGEVWVSAVTIPLREIAAGDEAVVYFVYSGWSETLSAAAGEYVYHE